MTESLGSIVVEYGIAYFVLSQGAGYRVQDLKNALSVRVEALTSHG